MPLLKRPRLTTLLAALLILIAVLWGLQRFALPALVRQQVRSALADLGLPDASFTVRSASLFSSTIADIRSANADLEVPALTVEYSPRSLAAGRLHSVELIGARVQLAIRDGRLDLGPLSFLTRDSSNEGKPLPFDELRLRSCDALLRVEDRNLLIPVDGSIASASAPAKLDIRALLQSTPLMLEGTIDARAGTVDLAGRTADVELLGLLAALPTSWRQQLPRGGGRFDLTFRFQKNGSSQLISANLSTADAWVLARFGEHSLAARRIALALSGSLTPDLKFSALSARLTSTAVEFDGQFPSRLFFQAEQRGGKLDFSLDLAGQDWMLSAREGEARALLETTSSAPATRPASLARTIQANCRIAGRLPAPLTDALLRRGIAAGELGSITLDGPVTAQLGPDWRVQLPRATLTLEPGNLDLPAARLSLRGLRLAGQVSARASSDGASISMLAGSTITVAAADSPYTRNSPLRPDRSEAPLLSLLIPAAAEFHLNKGEWSVQAPQLDVQLAPTRIVLNSNDAQVAAAQALLRLHAQASPAGATVESVDGSWVAFESAGLPGAGALHAGGLKTTLAAFKATLEPAATVASLQLRAAPDQALAISSSGNSVKLAKLSIDASLARRSDAPAAFQADVSFEGGSALIGQSALVLHDLAGRIPICFNSNTPKPGTFSAGSATVYGNAWPGLTGTARFANGQLDASARWSPLANALLTANAKLDTTAPEGLHGEIRADVPTFIVKDPETLGRLLRSARDHKVTGQFAAKAHLMFDRGTLTPEIILSVQQADLANKQYDLSIHDLSSIITIDSFSPFSTPGSQWITVAEARIGKLDLAKGLIAFRMERPDSILIEQTDWGWAGGRLYSHAFRFDPAEPVADFVVYGDNLALGQMLGDLAGPGSAGEGTVYGRLPVTVNWPSIAFGNGFLYAAPGGGNFSLGEQANSVGQLLEKDPRFAPGNPNSDLVRTRIVDSLKNFHYDLLRLDFRKTETGLTASLALKGTGKVGREQQELSLDLNINGFDELLRDFVVIKRMLGQ